MSRIFPSTRSFSRSLALAAGLALSASSPALGQALPTHPDLVMGELDNGLDYIILQHDNPPGRAQIYLNVSTGSLNETEAQRGIAHYLEHMAFNGGENFAPGEVVPFFESLGLTFGRHQNAYTTFNETVYILELPDNELDTFDKGLSFFEDVAGGLLLDETEIESERQVILNEERSGAGPAQRVRDYVFERIAPGSIFGERLPIGTRETISSVGRTDFQDYYTTYYTPSNMTFIAVADMEPWAITDALERRLGDGQAEPAPADTNPGITPYEESFAIVATDKELTEAEVSLVRIEGPRGGVTTEPEFRERLVESLAQAAFNRRIDRLIAEDRVRFRSAYSGGFDLPDTIYLSQVGATGDPQDWRAMLDDLGYEYQRARIHGFSAQELEDATKDLIASYERFAETEETLPARVHIGRINSAVASGDTIMSGKQRLEIAQKLIPGITASEVSDAFAAMSPDEDIALILEMPEGDWAPSEAEALAALEAALDVEPEPWSDAERATSLMTDLPDPGETVEITHHDAADVWSAWLGNGVRMHYRYMDERENNATISITLAGGAMFEDADTHGLTQAAGVVFNRPATESLTSTQITDLMTGAKAGVSGGAGPDSVGLTIGGSPEDFDRAFQLAHLLITEPRIEQPAFDQWKRATAQQIAQRNLFPLGQIQDALFRGLFPESEIRWYPLTAERLEEITLDDAQAWLEDRMDASPIEVSVVGDIGRERAFELVERYLGSLNDRPRIARDTYDNLRSIARKTGPIEVIREIDTQTPQAVVVAGSFAPDDYHREDTRRLRMATQILASRMIKTIREDEQLVYSIGANSIAFDGFRNMGLLFSAAPTDPGRGEILERRIHEMFGDFAQNGPTPEEVEISYGQILNTYDEQIKQAGYWAGVLSDLTYRDRDLDDVLSIREIYAQFTPEDIRQTFAAYYTPENTFSVIIRPEGTEPEAVPVGSDDADADTDTNGG